MPPRLNLFTNRERANSFGGAAQNYDAYRPRYPDELIDDVLAPDAHRVLDVGAGTGIASMQLIERGADLLAVEPDTRMAAVAQAKGIPVENAIFEQWEPAGRRFDRVVFAASFHWVDPAAALPKIRGILDDGGKLRRFVNVYVGDEDVRFAQGLDTPVPAGARVSVIPAVAGGAPEARVSLG